MTNMTLVSPCNFNNILLCYLPYSCVEQASNNLGKFGTWNLTEQLQYFRSGFGWWRKVDSLSYIVISELFTGWMLWVSLPRQQKSTARRH